MADKSISFSPAMATAVLTGRKTMTRRLLADGKPLPYAPGDTIWCRETHYRTGYWEQHYKTDQALRDNKPSWRFVGITDESTFELPRFCSEPPQGVPRENHHVPRLYRRPARFMFKAHARLHLYVEECYAQRLQDAPDHDFPAEGISAISKDGKRLKFGIPDRDGLPGRDNVGWSWSDWQTTPRLAFRRLWDSIHGDGAFDSNPLVSVTRFRPSF